MERETGERMSIHSCDGFGGPECTCKDCKFDRLRQRVEAVVARMRKTAHCGNSDHDYADWLEGKPERYPGARE